jgi:glycosyltransferase involved in cell wall biosynthesis
LKSRILIKKAAIKNFFENSKKVICVSNYTKKKLNNVIPFKINTTIIHHGIEPREVKSIRKNAEKLEKSIRGDKKIGKDTIILIYVSRLEPMKGQDKLIHLLGQKEELVNKIHTFFVGGGSQHKYLSELAKRYKILQQVTFTGEIPREDVLKYLSFSDILIFLSDHPRETFGLVILEAMSMKKPVIVLNHGGMVEVVQNNKNGLIVNADEIESKLSILVNDNQLRNKMGIEGRKFIEEKFNNMNMASETVLGLMK